MKVTGEADHAVLAVTDTGRGMSETQLGHIFDRFYRGNIDGGERQPGTGLGLAIVKSLVDLHDGVIEVESTLGEGATFRVRLPRAPSAVDSPSPRIALRGKRVLVVEDEPAIARLIGEQLRPHEVDHVIVHSGEAALAALRDPDANFDVITLDILLEGAMTGFEVLRELRSDEHLRRTPVVIVSVLSGKEALAGEWVVSKPIDEDELVDSMGSALLAGRSLVLVVARASIRDTLGPSLERLGLEYEWATNGAQAARMCEERRFEVALVDAGLRSPQTVLEQLHLRGRRLKRTVIVFSTGDDAPGFASLDAEPVPMANATDAVLAALGGG